MMRQAQTILCAALLAALIGLPLLICGCEAGETTEESSQTDTGSDQTNDPADNSDDDADPSDSNDGGSGNSSSVSWTITLSANCSGDVLYANVHVDGVNVRQITPGNSVTLERSPGNHSYEAYDDDGTLRWGPSSISLSGDTATSTLSCF